MQEDAAQLELPLRSWTEGMTLRSQEGKPLRRWGSVREAREMLWGMDRHALYGLIGAGEIAGVKPGKASNSHYRVDLLSVWRYKQSRLAETG